MTEQGIRTDRFDDTPFDRLPIRTGVAAVVAVAVNLLVVFAADAGDLAPGFRPLTAPPVVLLTIAGVVGATLLYWALRRRSATPNRSFRRIAAAVLVVSFLPDVGLLVGDEAATVAGVLVLMTMHAVVAAVSMAVLPGAE